MKIGDWIARFAGQRQSTRSHLVDSLIADRIVTRCGREMHSVANNGDLAPSEWAKCRPCEGK